MMNEYCYQVSKTRSVWVYAIDEEAAEVMVYEELGYDPNDMELLEVREDVWNVSVVIDYWLTMKVHVNTL